MRRLALGVFLAGCTPQPSVAPPRAPSSHDVKIDPKLVEAGRVQTEKVERRAARAELRVPAEVSATAGGAAEAGSLVAGRVVSIEAVEGDHVKRGQLLAQIESPEVGRAVAELLRARARFAVASKKLARQKILEREQATSGNALDDAQAEATEARAELAAAHALVRSVGADPPPEGEGGDDRAVAVRAAIRAPLDGVISRRDAVLGGAVTPDRALFKIVALGTSAIVARVPEVLASRAAFKEGALVHVIVRAADGTSDTCEARVHGTLGALDPVTRALPVRILPEAGCRPLRPSAFVDVVATEQATTDSLVVPRAALVEVRGVTGVFVARPAPGAFSFRAIDVTPPAGPDAIVVDGVGEGERVVTSGSLLLKGELLRAELEGG